MTTRDFIYSLPGKISPGAIEGHSTVFHFDLSGDQGGQYTVSMDNGEVKVSDGLQGEAKCVIRAAAEDFMKVLRGETNAMMSVLTGKIKISNQGEMMKYARLFGLM